MKSVIQILTEKGISVPEDHKIIFYNNSFYTSPIEVLGEDEYQDDYEVMLLPKSYPNPRTKAAVAKAQTKGYHLRVIPRIF